MQVEFSDSLSEARALETLCTIRIYLNGYWSALLVPRARLATQLLIDIITKGYISFFIVLCCMLVCYKNCYLRVNISLRL